MSPGWEKCSGWRAFGKPMSLSAVRNVASGGEPPVQRAGRKGRSASIHCFSSVIRPYWQSRQGAPNGKQLVSYDPRCWVSRKGRYRTWRLHSWLCYRSPADDEALINHHTARTVI